MQPCYRHRLRPAKRFQSSSGQKAGCNVVFNAMSRPFAEFQSSSGQKAGCNCAACWPTTAPSSCFNLHPARRPDATLASRRTHPCDQQGFQSSSGQKAGCNPRRPEGRMQPRPVSILIRPEGRMQPGCLLTPSRRPLLFQSLDKAPSTSSFNPHPARRPDATRLLTDAFAEALAVSILIRPEGRMQPLACRQPAPIQALFQSSSGQKAGCNLQLVVYPERAAGEGLEVSILIRPEGRMQRPKPKREVLSVNCFNPHPARRPDATLQLRPGWCPIPPCFNPHPARRPDATRSELVELAV